MKKVLIITYYWPPSGGGGVMRWLKMSKYLPDLGWTPIIYTPLNPDPSMIDESLLNEIHPSTITVKKKIWEPYNIYRRFTLKSRSQKLRPSFISEASTGNWKDRFSVFIRGNLLIPDPRVFWVIPSTRFLLKFIKENPVDAIITTGPPHSMHLIGMGLKRKLLLPWIADFRDPWSKIDFYGKLKLTWLADRLHKYLEKKVLAEADMAVTVSPNCAQDLLVSDNKQVELIYNGFDPADFSFIDERKSCDEKFSISHYGSLGRDRNPTAFWKVLGNLCNQNPVFKEKLEIQLIGSVDKSVIKSIEENNLSGALKTEGEMPHKNGLIKLSTSQLLLLPLNNTPNAKGILPGKLFEYLALKRPIIAIGPDNGDLNRIIKASKSGVCHDFNDIPGMTESIQSYFSDYLENKLELGNTNIEKFSRVNQAKEIVIKLNQLVGK